VQKIKYFPTYFTSEFIKNLKDCSSEQRDLFEIVYQIQFMAATGAKEACFYKKPIEAVIYELLLRGFIIIPATPDEIREDGLYYTISWAEE